MKRKMMMILLLAFAFFQACYGEKITVFVSIMPQKYIVDELSGGDVDAEVMVRPGFSPATYEPLPSQMEKLSRSSLFFTAGMPFEKIWVPAVKKRYPSLELIDMTAGIEKEAMDDVEEILSEHPGDHGHDHEALDPHVWLDPLYFIKMGENTLKALQKIEPLKSDYYRKNFERFRARILESHKKAEKVLSDSNIKVFAVFHPSWGYFARRYGLKQVPVEVSGKSPSPRELEKITAYLRSRNITRVFIQKEFSVHAAEYIARRLDGRVVSLSPLEYDYPSNILKTAFTIAGGEYE